ncbi:hypothetical protein KSS87_012367 [Heliosperma pusillum]|nr:hypothetical protein KSS87_012367 [Heliosperma pusillum]
MSQNNNINIPLEIGQEEMERMFDGKPVIPYKWKKGTGTGTLARHLESKHELDAKNYKSSGGKKNQPTMSGYASSAPGGGKPFFYNRQDMIDNMAKYVCMTEQPFTYGDSEELEEFVKLSLQPLYYKVSRQTLKRRYEYDTQLDVDYVIGIVHQLYALYENELGGQCEPTYKKSKMPTNTVLDHRLANKIFRKSSSYSSSSTSSSTAHTITEYLNFDHCNIVGQQPDILTWWRNHSAQFPILSKVARDVLAVPASIVASESAFSAGEEFLMKKDQVWIQEPSKCVCAKRIGIKHKEECKELKTKKKIVQRMIYYQQPVVHQLPKRPKKTMKFDHYHSPPIQPTS